MTAPKRRMHLLAILLVASILILTGCQSAGRTRSPDAADVEAALMEDHEQITEIVRSMVESDLAQPVEFESLDVRTSAPFVGVTAVPVEQDGDRIDYSQVPEYSAAAAAGTFDNQLYALLKRSGNTWLVIEYELGSTDYPVQHWLEEHGAPEGLF